MEGHRIDAETVKGELVTLPTGAPGPGLPREQPGGSDPPSRGRRFLHSARRRTDRPRLTFPDLVNLLLNKSGQDLTALHKLVSPRLVLSFAFSSTDSPLRLGPFSPENTLTILQVVKLFQEASRTVNLAWKPRFRHVEETSLVASSSRPIEEPTSPTRTGVVESWTVQLEWNLVYEAPPVAMHAELATTKKRFKVWKSGPRTVNLVFASSSGNASVLAVMAPEVISTTTSTELVTQAALAEAASNNGLQLVALEYSFETLPPPNAFWSFLGSATPLVLQRRAFKLFESILLTGLRLGLSSWTALAGVIAPQQQAPPSTVLPDPEAVAPPIQLRHHQRHSEPELQAEPTLALPTTDVIGTRRRWSVTSSSGGAPSSFGTPATLSAAAHLHLERPLAERHLHGSAPGSEVAHGHEPSHAHPPRPHHLHQHPHHPHRHHHRHSTDDGSFLTRLLSLPRQFLAMLFQIVQIIVVDFLALGDVFGKMIEMLLTYLQVSTTRIETMTLGEVEEEEDEGAPEEGREGPPPAGSMSSPSSAKQVSFGRATPDKPRSSKRYSLPLNPPPSPHLSPIVEASSPPPDDDEASELPLPPLAPHATPIPIPIPSGLVIPQSQAQALQLPIPSDADSLAVALHEQLAHEAAAQAQAQQHSERHKRRRSEFEFEFELEQEGLPALSEEEQEEEEEEEEEQNEEPRRRRRRDPPHVNPRTWMAHDLVAQEAASRARELEHVERMAKRFGAPGGPELGEFVEQEEAEEGVAAAAAEETPTRAEGVRSSSASTEARPGIRKTSSAPARSEHFPSPPPSSSSSSASCSSSVAVAVAEVATVPTALPPPPPASITTSSTSQQKQQHQQAGGAEPSSSLATQLEQERAASKGRAEYEALQDRLGLILYEPEPDPEPEPEMELEAEVESTEEQEPQPPTVSSSPAAAVGAEGAPSFVLKQETGDEGGGGGGGVAVDLSAQTSLSGCCPPSPSTTPQPPTTSTRVEPEPTLAPPPLSLAPACSTTLTALPPPPPVLKTKKSFDPSERGIGIARAFGQGQGQGQTAHHPSASARASPRASSSPTPTLGKAVSERAEEEEEATRRIEREQGPEPKSEPDIAAQEIIETGKGAHQDQGEEAGGESNPERDHPAMRTTQKKTDPLPPNHRPVDRSAPDLLARARLADYQHHLCHHL